MQIVAENDHVAVMFYEKGDERSEKWDKLKCTICNGNF